MSLLLLGTLAVGLAGTLTRRIERRRTTAALVGHRLDSIRRTRDPELAEARARTDS